MIVDVNVNLSRWPFRRLPHDDTPALVQKLIDNVAFDIVDGRPVPDRGLILDEHSRISTLR